MSTTAKARLQAAMAHVEKDLAVLTHPEDRAAYVKEMRELMSRSNAALRQSPHDKHTSMATSKT